MMRDFYAIWVVVRPGKYLNWFGVKDDDLIVLQLPIRCLHQVYGE
ncbi:hypothetical protein [Xylella fastidiosa]|nr:hypothetical protein [Xylella fastidiosa]